MSPKVFLLVFALAVLCGLIQAESLLKKLHKNQLIAPSHAETVSKTFDKLNRKTREVINKADSSVSGDISVFAKFFVPAAWTHDKLSLLSKFINAVSDHESNITVIGWQKNIDGEGNVKSINTIQLVIPPKPGRPEYIVDDDDNVEEQVRRVLPHTLIKDVREKLEPFALLGIPASTTMEEFSRNGDDDLLVYLDKDELFVRAEGFAIYNKTTTALPKEVSKFIAGLKPGALGKPSVLNYDVNGQLVADQTNVRPQMLGYVSGYYEATDKILAEGPEVIARIATRYNYEQVPEQLGAYYNDAYPEYSWRVLTDVEDTYITRDVSLTLTYDNFDFDENSDISWLVYGFSKNQTSSI